MAESRPAGRRRRAVTLARIPHSRPAIGRGEERAVLRVLRSRQLAQGREVERLEVELAARLQVRHAVAVASGSAALHLALLAAGVRAGDAVVAPSYVCCAVLNAIRYAGGRERLVDCRRDSFNLDPALARAAAPGASAIIVPHLFGELAELPRVARRGPQLIEDCAMALGASRADGRPAGSLGRVSIHSFYATKTLAGGEGGLLATDDEELATRARDLRSYDKQESWRLRFNYKMTDLSAALLRSQLRRLDSILAARSAIARSYLEGIRNPALQLPRPSPGSSWARFVLRTRLPLDRVLARLASAGIEAARPVHRPLHRYLGLPATDFPEAEDRFLTAFSLPIYPDLPALAVRRICTAANRL